MRSLYHTRGKVHKILDNFYLSGMIIPVIQPHETLKMNITREEALKLLALLRKPDVKPDKLALYEAVDWFKAAIKKAGIPLGSLGENLEVELAVIRARGCKKNANMWLTKLRQEPSVAVLDLLMQDIENSHGAVTLELLGVTDTEFNELKTKAFQKTVSDFYLSYRDHDLWNDSGTKEEPEYDILGHLKELLSAMGYYDLTLADITDDPDIIAFFTR